MGSLLDVSVLIALLDDKHIHHSIASDWLISNIEQGWMSCPITQNGFVRIVSQASYLNTMTVSEAVGRLNAAMSTPYHQFVADDINLFADPFVRDWQMLSSARLTDAYLLALAVTHDLRFVSLDRRVQLASIRDADARHLLVL